MKNERSSGVRYFAKFCCRTGILSASVASSKRPHAQKRAISSRQHASKRKRKNHRPKIYNSSNNHTRSLRRTKAETTVASDDVLPQNFRVESLKRSKDY